MFCKDVLVYRGVIVGQRATTEGRSTTGGVHRKEEATLLVVLPAVGGGQRRRGIDVNERWRGGSTVDLLSEGKAATMDGREIKSQTCFYQ